MLGGPAAAAEAESLSHVVSYSLVVNAPEIFPDRYGSQERLSRSRLLDMSEYDEEA